MLKRTKKNEKGFTMIELIIVVAIMGILAAILAPSFIGMSRSSKMNADINSVKILQKQAELYYAQNGKYPGQSAIDGAGNATVGVDTATGAVAALVNANLLDKKYMTTAAVAPAAINALKLQSVNVQLIWSSTAPQNQFQLQSTSATTEEQKIIADKIAAAGEDAMWVKAK